MSLLHPNPHPTRKAVAIIAGRGYVLECGHSVTDTPKVGMLGKDFLCKRCPREPRSASEVVTINGVDYAPDETGKLVRKAKG